MAAYSLRALLAGQQRVQIVDERVRVRRVDHEVRARVAEHDRQFVFVADQRIDVELVRLRRRESATPPATRVLRTAASRPDRRPCCDRRSIREFRRRVRPGGGSRAALPLTSEECCARRDRCPATANRNRDRAGSAWSSPPRRGASGRFGKSASHRRHRRLVEFAPHERLRFVDAVVLRDRGDGSSCSRFRRVRSRAGSRSAARTRVLRARDKRRRQRQIAETIAECRRCSAATNSL